MELLIHECITGPLKNILVESGLMLLIQILLDRALAESALYKKDILIFVMNGRHLKPVGPVSKQS